MELCEAELGGGEQKERGIRNKHTTKSRPEGREFSESSEENPGNVKAFTKLKRQIICKLLPGTLHPSHDV